VAVKVSITLEGQKGASISFHFRFVIVKVLKGISSSKLGFEEEIFKFVFCKYAAMLPVYFSEISFHNQDNF